MENRIVSETVINARVDAKQGRKKKRQISLVKELVSPFAEKYTKTRLERNGNEGSPKFFYFDSSPPLSLYLFCRARCRPECRLVVCKFFGMSARACNNFMEISSPAKHSHRVSRASNATRIEKRGKREEKKNPPCLLLYSPSR